MMHQVPESMKFRKLQRRLNMSKLAAVGTLELLWLATQKNTPRGDIGKFTDEELAIECEWSGDPKELVDALVDCGWLDRCAEHRLVVHDWSEHAPGWVKRQLARHKKSFVTVSSLLSAPDDTLEATPKEKKRKETKGKETISSEPSDDARDQEPVTEFSFPVVGSGSKDWRLSVEFFGVLEEAYPGVDVSAECKAAVAWCIANAAKRKTARGMTKFLNGWMERAQNRGSPGRGNGRRLSDDDLYRIRDDD